MIKQCAGETTSQNTNDVAESDDDGDVGCHSMLRRLAAAAAVDEVRRLVALHCRQRCTDCWALTTAPPARNDVRLRHQNHSTYHNQPCEPLRHKR